MRAVSENQFPGRVLLMDSQTPLLQIAIQHHQAGRFAEAEQIYRQILASNPHHADVLYLLGALCLDTGRPGEALGFAQEAIRLNPAIAQYHFGLADVYRVQGYATKARASYEHALELNPGLAAARINLGVLLQQLNLPAEAEVHYREVTRLSPGDALAWNNLATVLLARGDRDEARACLEQALRIQPGYADAHNTLGSVWEQSGDYLRARACFEQALRLRPDFATAHYNLGAVCRLLGNTDQALASFEKATAYRPEFVEAHYQCGAVLNECRLFARAQEKLERALQLRPAFVPALAMLASVLEYRGKTSEARDALGKALAIAPSSDFRIRAALALPIIYESIEQVHAERTRLDKELAELASTELAATNPAGCSCPFFLAYQGLNDREIMRNLVALYERAAPSLRFTAPHCTSGAGRQDPNASIRVGFISRFFFRHTIAKLNAGFIRHLSRPTFHVTLIRYPGNEDEMTRSLEDDADNVLILTGKLEEDRGLIADLRLDVLIYADIGMDPRTYFLGFSRLASVQCVAWGHPVTTGIPTIDYFLSSKLLEPADADEHYAERLVRFGHVNTCYAEPRLVGPARSRPDLGLPETGNLYLCTQSLYKIHPDFDAVLVGILKGDAAGRVVLLAGAEPHWKELLTGRFRRVFPEQADRVQFLPAVSQDDFLHLQALADVLLDTFPFGGGSTTYEALAFGTPVVTLPGAFLRGRITYACYQQMGVSDCIASDSADYVRIALRLGTDTPWRQAVRDRILAHKHLLYESMDSVRELETFLQQALTDARGKPSS